jgi:diguanylate cyclase (GGDEF)-like protein
LHKNVTDTPVALFSTRFRDPAVEAQFQQARLPQSRLVLIGMALIGVFGGVISSYGTYLSFAADSWVFQMGLLLRGMFIALAVPVVVIFIAARRPNTLYAWNAVGLALGCAVIALRMTLPPGAAAEDASLFHVSQDGVMLLLVVAMAELTLVPGWFAVNAAILSLALGGFLWLVYAMPVATEHPLNLILAAVIVFAVILGMGNAAQRLRRQTFLVHARLREANAQLEQLASTDSLTGYPNRRRFFELGEIECERSRRYNRSLSAIMMDIDHFKRVNDRYGHAVGDRVLHAVAATVGRSLRRGEVLGRIGGEEFAFLLPETDADGAVVVAERARRRIASLRVPAGDGTVGVTASFGVADNSLRSTDFDSLINRADTALYDAKHAGRNRVACQ